MSTEANKAVVRRFYEEVFNQRNVDAIDELVHAEFINHDPTPVASRDIDSMKQFIKTLTQAFPDHHHAIFQRKGFANEDLIAEDAPDLVATIDRKGLSAMDIVGVLTKAVQEQQKTRAFPKLSNAAETRSTSAMADSSRQS